MKARRWDEIMRIASTQVVVTAKVETVDGQVISIRQSTEAESKLSAIYDLLYIAPNRSGKENPCYTQIRLQKIRILEIRELHNGWLQCGFNRYSVKPNSPKAKPKTSPWASQHILYSPLNPNCKQ